MQKPLLNIELPSIKYKTSRNVDILRIASPRDFCLRIDLVATPELAYEQNWWMNVGRDTHIRPTNTNQRLGLINCDNMVIAPERYYFPSADFKKYFSMYFHSPYVLPDCIDVLETVNGNGFNFYGVSLIEQSKFRGLIIDLN